MSWIFLYPLYLFFLSLIIEMSGLEQCIKASMTKLCSDDQALEIFGVRTVRKKPSGNFDDRFRP